ncbi:MAG TPA: two-component regulator propeller domain-containing protein [Bacteroidales bacterium]|nr:two-component regulator propeller domain-containing protein [Bacteroidales bacterium]HPI85826.1 two-component regulator propeller domain-containing protein [Bacteroidales bacterium]
MKNISLLLISVLFVLNFNAQNWEFFTPENTGLPSDHVFSVATDSMGTMWFGTRSGLSRFDGTTWTNYNILNSGLPSDMIYAITIDKFGNKWLGTTGGIVKYNGADWIVYNKSNSGLPCDTISTIAIDHLNNKWFGITPKYEMNQGYIRGGILCFNDTTWTLYNSENSLLPSNYITALAIEESGAKWIGTYAGLAKLDGSEWTLLNAENSDLPSDSISSISIDKYNHKWIGFSFTNQESGHCFGGDGIAKFNDLTWQFYTKENSGLPSNNIYSIFIDEFENKWIGTTAGLVLYDDETWAVFNSSNTAMPDDRVNAVCIDTNGNNWISILTDNWAGYYLGAGIAQFDGSGWTLYDHANTGLPYYWISSVAIDHSGNKWVGTYKNGLSSFDGSKWTNYYRSNSGLPSDTINKIVIDSLGNIWIGTFGGVAVFDGNNWTVYNTSNSGLPSNIVYSIFIDRLGRKWFGTKDGLALFDDNQWTISDIFWVSSICMDYSGNLWVGTYGNGLYKLADQVLTNFTVFNSDLPSNWVIDLTADNSGKLWMGADEFGLATFDGEKWVNYRKSNSGIPDDQVISILLNDDGSKWIGTVNGFARFDDKTWEIFVPSLSGLPYNSFYSIARDSSGCLWLGTFGGLAKFYNYPPLNISEADVSSLVIYPNPSISNLNIGNLSTGSTAEIIDISGRLVFRKYMDSNSSLIDISDLQRGIYILKIQMQNRTLIERFVKQ